MTGHLVAGVGFSSRADADELVGLITKTLADAGFAPGDLRAIVSIERRAASGVAQAAAARLSAEIQFLDHRTLVDPRGDDATGTAALRALGISNVAEAAALRFGPLVASKRKSAHATCALSLDQGAAL